MRKNIVAGNWKMNTSVADGINLAKEINDTLKKESHNCDVVVCVPFTHIYPVNQVIDKNFIGLGAEDCSSHDKGAYTGEVSASMITSAGAEYVILGHSERRQYFGEGNNILAEKLALALSEGLKPIFCVGEVLEERENGSQNEVVRHQLAPLFNLKPEDFAKIVIAYEPVWAIGTGKTATSDQAEEMHAFIRQAVEEKFGKEAAENVSILYGGSCKPSNAKEIFSKPDVDGGLIGGAALKADSFLDIVRAFNA